MDGIKPRWDNQVNVVDELLANVKNFSSSYESEGQIYRFSIDNIHVVGLPQLLNMDCCR